MGVNNMSDTEQLKDFPIRTVIKVLRTDDIKIGTIPVRGKYLYKRTHPSTGVQIGPWSGTNKDGTFSESFGFYLESIQNAYNQGDIEILYPKQEMEEYEPQVGDTFMWIKDEEKRKTFIIDSINTSKIRLLQQDGEYAQVGLTDTQNLLIKGFVALVDGPCMRSAEQRVSQVSTPKNNDGRSNCYACGGDLKDWDGFLETHQVCVDCGK